MSDYTKQDWKDGTDGGTPITAARLAHIEDGIAGHTHSASDVTSGTLSADRLPTVPIAHGGTGATTAADALTALGAASASDLATVQDSVSHMASRSYVGWSTSVTFDSTSALLVFCGGKSIYGLWNPAGIPTLVKVSGSDVAGISVAKSGSAYVVSWTENAACIVFC